jgi:lactoylglutathione lyase
MIKISHIAINVKDLEGSINFFKRYFDAEEKKPHYKNPITGLETCFLSFDNELQIELMTWPEMLSKPLGTKVLGLVHIAISVGSKEGVDRLTAKMKNDGVQVLSGPRTTGDGYYESLIQDTEGSLIEITI